ncbi:MAG: hypothetical protein LBE46_01435 [Wolbachia pipientis]|jgi:hypothetical protein|nr:hypothetical protein [Wolbachia pipientis]
MQVAALESQKKDDVIPVWDPGKLIVNEQTFSVKLPKSWIPDWDDKKRVLG